MGVRLQEPDRLVEVAETNPKLGEESFDFSYPNFLNMKAAARAFEEVAGVTSSEATFQDGGEPARVGVHYVSPELLEVVRVRPVLGRGFAPDENTPTAVPVALISHGLWQRRFGGSTGVSGRTIQIDGRATRIVGVMPAGFALPLRDADVWMPIGLLARAVHDRSSGPPHLCHRPSGAGVTVDQAAGDVRGIAADLQQFTGSDAGHSATVRPLGERVVGEVRPALRVLAGSVAAILLLACVNSTGLLLARATTRRKDTAIRTTLGATRFRLARQLLTESVLLSGVAGLIGVTAAASSIGVVRRMLATTIPRADAIAIDSGSLAFSVAATLATGLVFGIVPALRASQANPIEDIKDAPSSSWTLTSARVRSGLVIIQIAVSLVLLTAAGLPDAKLLDAAAGNPGVPARAPAHDAIHVAGCAVPGRGIHRALLSHLARGVEAGEGGGRGQRRQRPAAQWRRRPRTRHARRADVRSR